MTNHPARHPSTLALTYVTTGIILPPYAARTFYAIDDTCTHRGGPLSEGMVMGAEVTCPWHGAVFDVTSGAVLGAPAPRGVARYAVRVEGEDIKVEL